MHDIYELKEMLLKELEEYGRKGELQDVGSLEIIDKLAHAVKNICKIIEAAEEEEYSGYGGSYDNGNMGGMGGNMGGTSSRGRSYRSNMSRAGRRSARRDSMGRYSGTGSRYSGNSYADGMEEMVDSIRSMMQELPPDVQKDAQRFVQKLEEQM